MKITDFPEGAAEFRHALQPNESARRLNLGAGSIDVPGYEPRDGARGDCLFPLSDADASLDEIRASHVLEHFPHAQTMAILKDWVRALKPGGRLRIAVPDFRLISQRYLDGEAINPEPYLMGGQIDDRDFHKAIFDEETLREQLRQSGLRGIRRWNSDAKDCAALDISLNLEGIKPSKKTPKVAAVLSAPRYGPVNGDKAMHLLPKHFRITVNKYAGAFWDQMLTRGIEQTIEEEQPEYIMTLDFDSLFGPDQIEHLLDLATRYPQADAIAPIQCQRGHGLPMFSLVNGGKRVIEMDRKEFQAKELQQVRTAHFGLTLLRVEALQRTPRPWFVSRPDTEGRWGDGRTDADIHFWRQWESVGNTLFLATHLAIGHLVERALWPDIDMQPMYQDPSEFWDTGTPERAWR